MSANGMVRPCSFLDQRWNPARGVQRHFRTASIHGGEVTLWVIRYRLRGQRRVCFAPVRDQVGAGAKRRFGPILLQKSVLKGAFGAEVFWTEPRR